MARGGRKKKSKKRSSSGILTADQRRDLVAVLLLALALFIVVALVPVGWFGARGGEWFPSGNPMGVVGGVVSGLLRAAFGLAAPAVPILVGLVGLRVGDWLSPARSWRSGGLVLALLLLLPVGAYVVAPNPEIGGWLGGRVGQPLLAALGLLGSLLVLGVLGVVVSVVTLRWNPVRTVATGAARSGELVGRGVGVLGERLKEARARAEAERAEAAARAAAAEEELPDEHWTGPETGESDDGASPEAAAPEAGSGADGGAEGEGESSELATGEDEGPRAPAPTRSPEPHDAAFPDPADPRDLVGGALPPLELLTPEQVEDRAAMVAELDRLGQILVEKLETFKVKCTLGGRTTGPVVTQFEVVPAPGVKVNRISNLDADLALAMKARSIRIVAPIPGKGAVGVEIPNPQSTMVHLRAILEAKEYRNARGVLPLALGKDLQGRPYVADLAKMPHLLIAGATGSGKSVCINTVITSLVYRHTPESLRLLMIDPKRVELSAYADLPHLRHDVITDPADAAGVLKWAVMEMERRYELLSLNGVRSLAEFNKRVREGVVMRRSEPEGEEGDPDRHIWDDGPLPYIVVVVDELADLMMQVQSEVEKPLAQLAQKARAIGIHLIVATQRPTVNVITGLIKANFPTRIAFRVASKGDSRTILDMNGAESLLGNGDMLFLPPGQSEPVRLQGAYIDTEETEQLLDWYRAEAEKREAEREEEGTPRPIQEPDIFEELRNHEMEDASIVEEIMGDWDELFRAAAEVCITNEGGSTSLLQRKLSIGYGRAARIVDQLEDAGVVGPQDGSKPRDILMTLDQLDAMMGPGG